MSTQPVIVISGEVVEERRSLSLQEFAGLCGLPAERIVEYVELGIIEPRGGAPREWRFPAAAFLRLQKARRLQRDLGIDAASLALVLDLLEEMERLRARMRRLGAG